MNVIVTGNLGYIGTVLTPMLRSAGHVVHGIDSDLYRSCTFGQGFNTEPTLRKDIRDVEPADLVGTDAVIHLAGLSNDPLGDLDPELTYEINYRASIRLAELARRAGVERFIFSSSCSNYGAGGQELLTEASPFNPVTPYGKSKVLVEQELSQMAGERFSPIFLRNATVFGLSPRLRFDLVLNNLVAWAFTTGKVHLKSDGSAWRPVVHVQDVALAFLAVLEAPRELVHNQAFNVARNDQNYRIRDLAEIVVRAVPGSQLEFASGASPDTRCYRVDCDKIATILTDFLPTWTATMGARELLYAYRAQGVTLDEFEGPRYQRVAHIRKLMGDGTLDESLRFARQGIAVATPWGQA